MMKRQNITTLLRDKYQSIDKLEELLAAFLKSALKAINFREGEIRILDFKNISSKKNRKEIVINCQNNEKVSDENSDSSRINFGSESAISIPIIYQGKDIGVLLAIPGKAEEEEMQNLNFLSDFAREIAFFIKRYEANNFCRHYLKKNLMLLGCSDASQKVDTFIEGAAQVNYPVIIQGEFGTEKAQIASAIHYNSAARNQPFLKINCSVLSVGEFEKKLEIWFNKARGGTIFFNGIDELKLCDQYMLPWHIESRLGQWIGNTVGKEHESVRVIVSTCHDLAALVKSGKFSKTLFAELNFLKVILKPLKTRKEDIDAMLTYMLAKYSPMTTYRLSEEARILLKHYAWPENLYELEQVIARLVTFTYGGIIDVQELKQYAPEVLEYDGVTPQQEEKPDEMLPQSTRKIAPKLANKVVSKIVKGVASAKKDEKAEKARKADSIIHQLLRRDFSCLQSMHPGLQKAIRYLAENFTENISLTALAKKAYISAPHLSSLFKSFLNKTFKQFLSAIRVERAKELLKSSEKPRITDVSLAVGFGDLSHFEKIFKRFVSMTPTEYRRQNLTLLDKGVVVNANF